MRADGACRGRGWAPELLTGFGGAGKSTLVGAVSRSRRLRRRYKTAVWLKAEPGTDPLALLTRLARPLGVTDPAYASVDQARDELKALLHAQTNPSSPSSFKRNHTLAAAAR
ncbi:hypothetical protein [Actinomadura nitritigenes]|uniref:hypothetical protein n=1 Tax=Actinomadura nitritigenes TaxID=134602 RepID=UPI003D8C8E0F